jgi:isopentenyl diphosphate isomerase/L-lactate dehydrogenase-like FMN-dependent dehydrogenase
VRWRKACGRATPRIGRCAGVFGQPGVERVLTIQRAETGATMQQIGAPSLQDLKPEMVKRVR